MLTGIALEKFNKWYNTNITFDISGFNELDFRFKWGVLDAFFNKYGLFPEVIDTYFDEPQNKGTNKRFHTVVRTYEKWTACGFHKTKLEAQKEFIEVANDKLNLKYI